MSDDLLALAALRGTQAQLRAAYADANTAASHLAGARATRAAEMAEKLADCIAFSERLLFICVADHRYQELRER
ncbi:MAG TPA: hypothetical protein VKG83_01680 [Mycobacterium sp.]|nr:hypothetical protein [Mycobacterium sp.]